MDVFSLQLFVEEKYKAHAKTIYCTCKNMKKKHSSDHINELHLLLPLTNSDVFSAPAAAAWNTRTATSNSLHRHSRRRKTNGKTAFMITCYHSARIVVTLTHSSPCDIVTRWEFQSDDRFFQNTRIMFNMIINITRTRGGVDRSYCWEVNTHERTHTAVGRFFGVFFPHRDRSPSPRDPFEGKKKTQIILYAFIACAALCCWFGLRHGRLIGSVKNIIIHVIFHVEFVLFSPVDERRDDGGKTIYTYIYITNKCRPLFETWPTYFYIV